MTGYVRKDTTNNIADGNVINAADLDAEFDGVQDAFNASTGHKHDGTAGEGATINALGPTQDVTVSAVLVAPKTTNTVDIGSNSLKFKDLFLAGNGSVGGTLAVTGVATFTAQPILSSLTASRAVFSDGSKGLVSNAITGTGNVVMSASPTLTGTIDAAALTASGNVTLSGGTANGVAYLNGSKVVTSGSALTFDGTNLGVGAGSALTNITINGNSSGGFIRGQRAGANQWFVGDTASALGSGTGLINFVYGNDPFIWYNGGTSAEQMRLTSTGLGIGTSSPAQKLDVIGAIKATIASTASNNLRVGNSGSNFYFATENSAGGSFCVGSLAYSGLLVSDNAIQLSTTNGASVQATLNTSGNLGLGVTPSAWGYFKAAQVGVGCLAAPTNAANTVVYNNAFYDGSTEKYITSNAASQYQQLDGSHIWKRAASGTAGNAITFTQAMTLDASGNLLVGITSGSYKFMVGDGTRDMCINPNSTLDGIFLGTIQSKPLVFGTGNTERARITSGGNFLLGTTSDFNNITLGTVSNGNGITWGRYMNVFSEYSSGASYISSNYYPTLGAAGYKTSLTASFGAAGISISGTSGAGNSGLIQFFVDPATSKTSGNAFTPTEAARIDSSGNMGIGATSITSGGGWTPRLVLEGTTAAMIVKGGGAQEASVGSSNSMYIDCLGSTTGTNNNIIFRNTSSNSSFTAVERARIDSAGVLLVSRTSYIAGVGSACKLQVLGDQGEWSLGVSNGGTTQPYGILMTYGTAVNTSNWPFFLGSDTSATRFSVYSNGGIANYQANDVNLSDRREKTNFAPAGSYLDKICAIPVQTFNYIDQNMEDDGGLTLGVVAQDVQAVAPELVMESNWAKQGDAPKMRLSIYQTDLQYALMKCIQEQQAIIENLKARLDAANL
jgi:hypothetical protein